jgi:hemerythrin
MKEERIMHPIDHYETIRRGHEELLKRAENERMARKAKIEQRTNRNIYKAANWLGMHLVSWGAKLEKFGAVAKRQPTPTTTTRVRVRRLFKMSPHH